MVAKGEEEEAKAMASKPASSQAAAHLPRPSTNKEAGQQQAAASPVEVTINTVPPSEPTLKKQQPAMFSWMVGAAGLPAWGRRLLLLLFVPWLSDMPSAACLV